MRCISAGTARRGEIINSGDVDGDDGDADDNDEDVTAFAEDDDEGEHEPWHLGDALATGTVRQHADDRAPGPRGCTRAARELRIAKGIGKEERGRRNKENKTFVRSFVYFLSKLFAERWGRRKKGIDRDGGLTPKRVTTRALEEGEKTHTLSLSVEPQR